MLAAMMSDGQAEEKSVDLLAQLRNDLYTSLELLAKAEDQNETLTADNAELLEQLEELKSTHADKRLEWERERQKVEQTLLNRLSGREMEAQEHMRQLDALEYQVEKLEARTGRAMGAAHAANNRADFLSSSLAKKLKEFGHAATISLPQSSPLSSDESSSDDGSARQLVRSNDHDLLSKLTKVLNDLTEENKAFQAMADTYKRKAEEAQALKVTLVQRDLQLQELEKNGWRYSEKWAKQVQDMENEMQTRESNWAAQVHRLEREVDREAQEVEMLVQAREEDSNKADQMSIQYRNERQIWIEKVIRLTAENDALKEKLDADHLHRREGSKNKGSDSSALGAASTSADAADTDMPNMSAYRLRVSAQLDASQAESMRLKKELQNGLVQAPSISSDRLSADAKLASLIERVSELEGEIRRLESKHTNDLLSIASERSKYQDTIQNLQSSISHHKDAMKEVKEAHKAQIIEMETAWNSRVDHAQSNVLQLQGKIDFLEKDNGKLTRQVADMQETIDKLRRDLSAAEEQHLARLKQASELQRRNCDILSQSLAQEKSECRSLRSRNEEQHLEVVELKKELAKAEESLQNRARKADEELKRVRLEMQDLIDAANKKSEDLAQQLSETNTNHAETTSKYMQQIMKLTSDYEEKLAKARRQATSELKQLDAEAAGVREQLQTRISSLEADREKLDAKAQDLENRVRLEEAHSSMLKHAQSALERQTQEARALHEKLAELQASEAKAELAIYKMQKASKSLVRKHKDMVSALEAKYEGQLDMANKRLQNLVSQLSRMTTSRDELQSRVDLLDQTNHHLAVQVQLCTQRLQDQQRFQSKDASVSKFIQESRFDGPEDDLSHSVLQGVNLKIHANLTESPMMSSSNLSDSHGDDLSLLPFNSYSSSSQSLEDVHAEAAAIIQNYQS